MVGQLVLKESGYVVYINNFSSCKSPPEQNC